MLAIMSVSLRGLLARLRMAARLAEKVSKDNLELFTEEALGLVSRGDIRDAAEKAWAAYKALLGLILATRGIRLIEERIRRTWEQRGPEKAEKELEWWIQTGFLVPSARQKLGEVARLAAEAVNDKEIYQGLAEAILLHLWFYHGPDTVPLTEEGAKERILELIDWIKKKAKQYRLL